MNALVVYYSLEGNTGYVAQEIAKNLEADLLELKPEKNYSTGAMKYFSGIKDILTKKKIKLEPYEFRKEQYEAIIIGTPVWAGTVTPPVRTFLEAYDLSDKKVGFFACCGGGETKRCFLDMGKCCNVKEPLTLKLVEPLKKQKIEDEVAIRDFSDLVHNQ